LVLPAATNIAAILLVIALFLALVKQVGALDRLGILATLAKSLAGSVAMGSVAYGIFWLLPGRMHKIPLLIAFVFVFCLVGWVYFLVTKALGMPETAYLSRAIDRISKRKAKASAV
jgi:hypothetical protein